jgi:drug/metabolite transporter (DMT)-like permease
VDGSTGPHNPLPRVRTAESVALPPARDLALLLVAISAISTSAPIIASTAAPALAVAFWRNGMASIALVPVALLRSREELRGLSRREWLLCLLAGVFLAGHFGTWVPSVRLTSVASATALVATQPIWAAVLARAAGRRVSGGAWLGIVVAVVGAVLLTGADLSLSGRALVGDLMATVGGALAAAYVTAGAAVRARVSTTAYTSVCYTTCSLLLVLACLLGGQRLAGYGATTWLRLAALTIGAQLLGHSLVNVVLRSSSPTLVSLVILFEVPGASLIAAVWLGQRPAWSAVPGLALLVIGVGLVVRAGARGVPVE